ncbi:hypothetical protein PMAYCL1PPCAC_20216, partial [Pristionchus mayeri]
LSHYRLFSVHSFVLSALAMKNHCEQPLNSPLHMISQLEQLPVDLIWRIFDLTPESMLTLRLTSRILKHRTEQYDMRRPIIDVVTKLTIIGPSERSAPVNPSSRICVLIQLPICKSREFWRRLVCESAMNLIKDREVKVRRDAKIYRLYFYVKVDLDRMEYVGSCLGKKIARIALTKCSNGEAQGDVAKLLNGIEIGHLKISDMIFSDDLVSQFMQHVNVDRLSMIVKKVDSTSPEHILLSISTLVRCLHIKQQCVDGIESTERYFMGVTDFDWVPTILEMLSGKVDKLLIDNFFYPEFLSKSGAETLREKIPGLGRNIWFESSCDHYEEGLSYNVNGSTVKVDSSYEFDPMLIIKPAKEVKTDADP